MANANHNRGTHKSSALVGRRAWANRMVVRVGSSRVYGMWEGAWNVVWRNAIGRAEAGVRGGLGGPG